MEEEEQLIWDDDEGGDADQGGEEEDDGHEDAPDEAEKHEEQQPQGEAASEDHHATEEKQATLQGNGTQATGMQDDSKPEGLAPSTGQAAAPQASDTGEPKRRFPPARIKPPDGPTQAVLNKALGSGSKLQSPAGKGSQQAQQGQPKFQQQQSNQQGSQGRMRGRRNVRYFILRSNPAENIEISVQAGGWATPRANELNAAFSTCDEVRLVFAASPGSHFSGYAIMRSSAGQYPGQIIWSNGRSFGNPFSVEWRIHHPLPFERTSHLRNPMNDNKPVHIARDGTEVPADVGDALVALMEQQAMEDGAPPPSRAGMRGARGGGAVRGRGPGGMPGGGFMGGPGQFSGRGRGMGNGMMGGQMGRGMGMNGPMNTPMMMGSMQQAPGMMQGAGGGIGAGMGMGMGGMRGTGGPAMGQMMGGGMGGMGPGMMGGGIRERSRSPPRSLGGQQQGWVDTERLDRERQRDGLLQHGSNGNAPDLLSMSYDEYMEYYKRMHRKVDGLNEAKRGLTPPVSGMGSGMTNTGNAPAPPPGASGMSVGMPGVGVGMNAGMGAGAGMAGMAGGMKPLGVGMPAVTGPVMGMQGMGNANPQQQQQQQMNMMMQQQQQLQQQQMNMMGGMHPMAMNMPGMNMGMPGLGTGMPGMNPMAAMAGMGGMNPMIGMMNPMMAGMATGMGSGMMMPSGGSGAMAGGPGMMMGQAGTGMMGGGMGGQGPMQAGSGMQQSQNKPFTEDEYIQFTVQHFKSQGRQPPDMEFIRAHYRQQKRSLEQGSM